MITRRLILKLSASSLAVTLPISFANAQQPGRKNVSQLPPNAPDIVNYARAVEIMKSLPTSDPRSWDRQADIHNSNCPHSNWWILPWHRAYIYYFEQICRDVLKMPTFSLPYWDWSRNPRIPAPFWSGSLNHKRDVSPNDDMPSETIGLNVVARIMNSNLITTFFSGATTTDNQRERSTSGTLEGGPHNSVHSTIGQRGADMSSFLSPRDPIFWLHHANIDRLWTSWARAWGDPVPSQTLWADHDLATFFDPSSNQFVSPKASLTRDAGRWNSLYDRYEISTTSSAALASAPAVTTAPAAFVLGRPSNLQLFSATSKNVIANRAQFSNASIPLNKPVTVPVTPSESLNNILTQVVSGAESAASQQAYLSIEGIKKPTGRTTGFRVFLNCRNPSINTPISDPSYVSTVTFFGEGSHNGNGHAADSLSNFILPINDVLKTLAEIGQYSSNTKLDVTLVPLNFVNPGKSSNAEGIRPSSLSIIGVL